MYVATTSIPLVLVLMALVKNLPLSVSLGANNLLDVYPDVQAYDNSYFGVFRYAPVQQGMLGSFFYARLNFAIK